MDGNTRRQAIIKELTQAAAPLSGNTLAAKMSVSRQGIVQDIALLRTEYPILAKQHSAKSQQTNHWQKHPRAKIDR